MYGDLGPRALVLGLSLHWQCQRFRIATPISSEMRRPRLMMYNMYLEIVFSDDQQIQISLIAWKLNV
jgi:hypothetical protein